MREVRIRRNHVQAAVLRLIRMRLIARIHNRAANRGLQTNRALKEISTRTNLKTRNLTVRTNTHTARTRKNHAGRKERQERIRNLLKRNITANQVVFVGAVRLALRVGVVLVQLHLRQILRVIAQLHQRLVRQRVTGSVIEHRIGGGQNLRRRVLRMRMIHIQARTIGQNRVHGHAVPVQTLRETTAAVHTGERIQGATRLGGFTRCLNPRLTHNLQGDIFAGQLGAGVRHLARVGGGCVLNLTERITQRRLGLAQPLTLGGCGRVVLCLTCLLGGQLIRQGAALQLLAEGGAAAERELGVGVDHQCGQHGRVGARRGGGDDAVLGFGTHNAVHAVAGGGVHGVLLKKSIPSKGFGPAVMLSLCGISAGCGLSAQLSECAPSDSWRGRGV